MTANETLHGTSPVFLHQGVLGATAMIPATPEIHQLATRRSEASAKSFLPLVGEQMPDDGCG